MPRRDFQSPDDLVVWLVASGIDVSEWGNGDSKTTADLWHEFVVGESSFIDYPPGRLVEVAQLLIRRGDAILIEIEQEFADGRRRVRMRPPSEKLVRGEEPRTAAIRCLKEELGLSSAEVTVGADHEITEESVDSPSYPGLPTHYRFHTFEVATDSLPDGDFYRENIAPGDPVRRHLWGWRAEWAVNSIQ
ncbi:MAG TPA: NUDIX domain-containing protein [Promineifilum sp.]|nr:NUDIX domain-containing protein [Promineifilum sp.]HRO90155.1 NUDIX domain-containing protein [Promineifilum sp.]HRQ11738.1 NUDIX domain-containing protein [Promineifilum sp.]